MRLRRVRKKGEGGEPEGVLVASLKDVALPKAKAAPAADPTYYFHFDHLGMPWVMTDANRQVTWAADYEPFGKVHITVEQVVNNFRFPGQYEDRESGLNYNWHRFYHPTSGRYAQPDPLLVYRRDPGYSNSHTFSYAGNSPANRTDRFGLADIPWFIPNIVVVDYVRARAKDYGYDTKDYTDEEILDFIRFVPQNEADEFRKSYESRPDVGEKTTKEQDEANRRAFEKEKKMLDKAFKDWEKHRKTSGCPVTLG